MYKIFRVTPSYTIIEKPCMNGYITGTTTYVCGSASFWNYDLLKVDFEKFAAKVFEKYGKCNVECVEYRIECDGNFEYLAKCGFED